MLGNNNKRKYPRRRSYNLVKLQHPQGAGPGKSASYNVANILNISEGGIRFSCRDRLALDAVLNMTINLGEYNRQIDVEGKVIWGRKQQGVGYHFGVTFTKIEPSDLEFIRDMIEPAMVNPSNRVKLWFHAKK